MNNNFISHETHAYTIVVIIIIIDILLLLLKFHNYKQIIRVFHLNNIFISHETHAYVIMVIIIIIDILLLLLLLLFIINQLNYFENKKVLINYVNFK